MAERDPLQTLHSVVHTYLATLMNVADCLGEACPPVGGPHRHRLERLRTRLSFDASKEAIEQSAAWVRVELKEYAAEAAQYINTSSSERRRASAGLEEILRTLAQRQDFYAARLRQFASQMETTTYPADPKQLADVVALQATGLVSCVESMTYEAQSLVSRMQMLMADVERRLAEAEITDLPTGLMNRRETERRIASRRHAHSAVTQLLIQTSFEAPAKYYDELAKQIAYRLSAQTRHNDLLGRWSDHEFMVLFHGPAELAEKRGGQMAQALNGRYTLEDGEGFEVAAKLAMAENCTAGQPAKSA